MADTNVAHIGDLVPDARNARRHNPRNIGMIASALQEVGAARSIVIDEHNNILAGNGTVEAAAQVGIERVRVVEADGNEIIAVRRTGLSKRDKKRLALYDNRTAELAEWEPQVLADERDILDGLFSEHEVGLLLAQLATVDPWNPAKTFDEKEGDGIGDAVGYSLSSIWYDLPADTTIRTYMLPLPPRGDDPFGTIGRKYSRTNAAETERIVKTYMRPGDKFYEMCCGWMTFSSTAKYLGFSGRGSDIWDVSLDFCKRQLEAMPGEGVVDVVRGDCRDTGEPSGAYDFVHSNPPFFNLEPYGGTDSDLAGLGSYERWLDAMGDMGREAERILKPGGLANFVINDYREKEYLVAMHADFSNAVLRKSGLVLHDIVTAEVISQRLRFRRQDFDRRRTVKCHEYVITFRKPNGAA